MKKFNPDNFCIDDLFDYIGKHGKKLKDKLTSVKKSKKSKSKKTSKKESNDALYKTASSIETPTVQSNESITVEL